MKYCKLIFIALSIALLALSPALSQIELNEQDEEMDFREVPLSENARIEFEHTTFDFGSITKGASVAHSYWFTNTGTDTLVITKIIPTCGCTSTKKGGIIAAPGEKASIDIIFNSGKFNGRVTKVIKLETNDKLNPYMDIRFKSNINNPKLVFDYVPYEADFKTVPVGKTSKFKVNITNNDDTESNISLIDQPSASFIKSQLSETTIEPGKTATLELELLKGIEPGEYISSITLEDTNKKNSRFSIPIALIVGEKTASR